MQPNAHLTSQKVQVHGVMLKSLEMQYNNDLRQI